MSWLSFRLAYFRGVEALRKEDWVKAESFFRKALQIRPLHPETILQLAQTLQNLKMESEARALIDNLIQSHPNLSEPYFLLGDFEKAVSLDPKNSNAWHELGKTALLNQDFKKALLAFRKAVEIDPFLLPQQLHKLEELVGRNGI